VEGVIPSRLDPKARLRNIIVSSLPEQSDEPRIALCAHLDSMYTCPGANDNGGGLAALLALARHYAAHRPAVPLEFIFFNGEEWDLAGSKAYVARYVRPSQAGRYKLLLNLDGVSETVDGLQFWVGPEGFSAEFKKAVDQFGWERPLPKVYKFPPPLGSDHVPFYNVGVPVCMFTGYDIKKYHLPTDVYWDGGVDSICYVAELTRHLVDYFAARETRSPSRENRLALKPYFWSALEA
jgi:Zn-dependent M28 family amino/carboxypeptidase